MLSNYYNYNKFLAYGPVYYNGIAQYKNIKKLFSKHTNIMYSFTYLV